MLPNAVVHSQSYSVALGSLVSIPRGAETIQVSGQDHPFCPPPLSTTLLWNVCLPVCGEISH
jgi:hypothetical protein